MVASPAEGPAVAAPSRACTAAGESSHCTVTVISVLLPRAPVPAQW